MADMKQLSTWGSRWSQYRIEDISFCMVAIGRLPDFVLILRMFPHSRYTTSDCFRIGSGAVLLWEEFGRARSIR